MLKINELYKSIQGEGTFMGAPTVFVRFQGCNLSCSYCDTKFSQSKKGGKEYTVEQLVKEINEMKTEIICLTGGEPLLQPQVEMQQLINALITPTRKIIIETNGTIDVRNYFTFPVSALLYFNIDYKFEAGKALCRDMFYGLAGRDTVKFVISNEREFFKAIELAEDFRCPGAIYFTWDGGKPSKHLSELIVEYCTSSKFRLGIQLHKFIWGNERSR